MWKLAQDGHAQYAAGKLDAGHMVQFGTAWMTTYRYLPLRLLKGRIDKSILGPGAYLIGCRVLRLEKASAAAAAPFFRIALENASPGSTLQRLAKSELDRSKKP